MNQIPPIVGFTFLLIVSIATVRLREQKKLAWKRSGRIAQAWLRRIDQEQKTMGL